MEGLLGDFQRTESTQLAESLALQASRYMQAAWRITGEPIEELTRVVDDARLDTELMHRWIRFLARAPRHYPYLKDWQSMIERGGAAAEAKRLAEEFQTLLLDVMFERKELNKENEVILAEAMPGTRRKERRMKPNEFVTNADFCPGCGVETKAMPLDRTHLWIDVFQRDLDDVALPNM